MFARYILFSWNNRPGLASTLILQQLDAYITLGITLDIHKQ